MSYYEITRNMTKEVDTINTSPSGVKRMIRKIMPKPPMDKERDQFNFNIVQYWTDYWLNTQQEPRDIEQDSQDEWIEELIVHITNMINEFREYLAKYHVYVLRIIFAFSLLGVSLSLDNAKWLYNELCELGFNPVCYQNILRNGSFVILLGSDDLPSGYKRYSLT
ncbi:MAG: hypothetical protein ACTSUO_02720 [Candidatus Thorarchaeota archaeon]